MHKVEAQHVALCKYNSMAGPSGLSKLRSRSPQQGLSSYSHCTVTAPGSNACPWKLHTER